MTGFTVVHIDLTRKKKLTETTVGATHTQHRNRAYAKTVDSLLLSKQYMSLFTFDNTNILVNKSYYFLIRYLCERFSLLEIILAQSLC